MRKYPISFKIYPEPRRNNLYYKVFVFKDDKQMYYFAKEMGKGNSTLGNHYRNNFNFDAICTWYGKRVKRFPNQIGHVLVHVECAKRSTVIVHELLHATMYYFWYNAKLKWGRIKNNKRTEERFCHILGNLNGQYWGKWWELKLN